MASRDPVRVEIHGHTLIDDYAWLRNREDPRTAAYLAAENAYAEAAMAPTSRARERLVAELRGYVPVEDRGAPTIDGPWAYLWLERRDREYPTLLRRAIVDGQMVGAEQVVADFQAMAAGHDYFAVGAEEVCPDGRRIALAIDTRGDERMSVLVRDIATGAEVDRFGGDVSGELAWAADCTTLFYARVDGSNRAHELWRREVGRADSDVRVLDEPDPMFALSVEASRSEAFVIVTAASQVTTEVRVIPAGDPNASPQLIEPRQAGVKYGVAHAGDRFYVVNNRNDREFRVDVAPVASPSAASWRPFFVPPGDGDVTTVEPFARHVAIGGRQRGLPTVWITDLSGREAHDVAMPDAAYELRLGPQPEVSSDKVRLEYSTLAAPDTSYDYDPTTRELVVVDRDEVPGHDPGAYVVERLGAKARDGTEIPISLVRHRARDGSGPLLLRGYGAYGAEYDAAFVDVDLPLLTRDVAVAIAHVRGGGEFGRRWYEGGKLRVKHNSFDDFIACAEALVAQGLTAPEQLAISGGSAGGLLVAAATNRRPDLFGAVVAHVPFVDVINTMRDASLPLTATEWEEWGDPRNPDAFADMLAYSPYENVRAAPYPAMLITGGWNDPRVGYWEPAKWTARLRAVTTGTRPILLRIEMEGGHQGATGRTGALRERAFELAFLFDYWRIDTEGAKP